MPLQGRGSCASVLKSNMDERASFQPTTVGNNPFFLTVTVVSSFLFLFFVLCDDTNRSLRLSSTSYHVAVVRGIDTNDALLTNLINNRRFNNVSQSSGRIEMRNPV